MANRRMINKDDIEHPNYSRLSIRQRYLFDHLMVYADDDGIIPYIQIKPKIFPTDRDVDDAVIMEDLRGLEAKGYLLTYQTEDGELYASIQDWWRRQSLRAELYRPTIFPLPPNYTSRPESITPGPKPRKRIPATNAETNAAQSRGDKPSPGQANLEENSVDKVRSVGPEDLPWEENGSINPMYK